MSHPEQANQNMNRLLIDLVCCVILPTLILKYLSSDTRLGTNGALLFALSLPLIIGVWELISVRKIGIIPILGVIGILLTGGIGLLKLPKEYIAYKEALIPAVIGLITVATTFTSKPLAKRMMFNDAFIDTERVESAISEQGNNTAFEKKLKNATWIIASSFLLSTILNYVLAKKIIVSETGTDAFNSELGSLTVYSYLVIALPCMVILMYTMYYVFKNISTLSGLTLDEIVRE